MEKSLLASDLTGECRDPFTDMFHTVFVPLTVSCLVNGT
jgi:hypothetical protein